MLETGAQASSPLGALKELVSQSERVARAEVRLMVAEYVSAATVGMRRVVILLGSGVFGCFAVGYLIHAAFLALLPFVAPWLAALIVAAVLGVLSGGLLAAGFRRKRSGDETKVPLSLAKLTRNAE